MWIVILNWKKDYKKTITILTGDLHSWAFKTGYVPLIGKTTVLQYLYSTITIYVKGFEIKNQKNDLIWLGKSKIEELFLIWTLYIQVDEQ